MRVILFSFALLLGTVACETAPGDAGAGGPETPGPPGTRAAAGPPAAAAVAAPTAAAAFSSHPCSGDRTDTMWFDDPDHVWVGCGSTAEGYGLFRSTDGGQTWDAPETSPAGALRGFRVDSISRSADGLLYVAGTDPYGPAQVVSLDDAGVLGDVSSSTGQIWNSFQAGGFRRNSQGVAIAESLTGTEVIARFGDGSPWVDGYGWWGGYESYQILDLTLYQDEFYAVGSTTNQPPMLFLPPKGGMSASTGLRFDEVQLAEYYGELYGIDVDAGGVVAAGVDQDRDVGYVFTSGAEPSDLSSWRALDVSTILPSEATWMRGACRSGATVVAVGEYSRRGAGIVLRSGDGGATWSDVTPSDEIDLPAVQRCKVWEDGSFSIAGADGLFATFVP